MAALVKFSLAIVLSIALTVNSALMTNNSSSVSKSLEVSPLPIDEDAVIIAAQVVKATSGGGALHKRHTYSRGRNSVDVKKNVSCNLVAGSHMWLVSWYSIVQIKDQIGSSYLVWDLKRLSFCLDKRVGFDFAAKLTLNNVLFDCKYLKPKDSEVNIIFVQKLISCRVFKIS